MSTKKPFIIPEEYPFKEQLADQAMLMRIGKQTEIYERITIIRDVPYIASAEAMFVKLFQHSQVLNLLSPYASKVLIFICTHLKYGETSISIPQESVMMGKNTFYKAIRELMMANVLRKVQDKKELYWINVAMVSNGDAHNKLLR